MCSLLRSLILFPLASVFGCGFGGSGDVFGKVSLNGKPLTAGTVVIVGADKLPYTGKIGESGAYAIEKVPSGPAKISVVSPSPEMDRQPAQLDRESPFAKKNAKFNS